MHRLERDPGNLTELLLQFGRTLQSELWTALPGRINSYDPASQTGEIEVTLTVPTFDVAGTRTEHEIPLLLDVPIFFPNGGGYTLTFPVVKGDECLVVFSSRCIDQWWDKGGVQPQHELRMHDLSDGFAFVGFRSKPKVLSPAPSTAGVELRADDGATKLSIEGTTVTVMAAIVNVDAAAVNLSDGASLKALVDESFITLFNSHTHAYAPGPGTPVPTAPPLVPSTVNVTTKVKAS